MARDWDATAYDRLPIPMTAWGEAVLERLDLAGDERALDAGCGTGKVTAALMARLPHGSVVALDGSAAMIERARSRLGDLRVEYVVADLREPLPLAAPVDAVFSTATFHWIPDHEALFRNLAAVLRPGGQLVAQCGGAGNIASIESALRDMGEGLEGRKHFATPEVTTARLEAAGFTDIRCWLQDAPTPVPDDDLEPYLEAICLGDHVEDMTPEGRSAFVHEVATRMPAALIDYVRLNIDARHV
jgi:trans-aconitate 2-methyltransferase